MKLGSAIALSVLLIGTPAAQARRDFTSWPCLHLNEGAQEAEEMVWLILEGVVMGIGFTMYANGGDSAKTPEGVEPHTDVEVLLGKVKSLCSRMPNKTILQAIVDVIIYKDHLWDWKENKKWKQLHEKLKDGIEVK
jgi:hypothetical protein